MAVDEHERSSGRNAMDCCPDKQGEGQRVRCFAAWRITYACNFKCPYCTSGRSPSPEAPGGLRSDLHEHIDEVLANFARTRRDWTIAFTGGEPLVYPKFVEICRRIAEEHWLYLDTNMSLPIDELVAAVPAEKVEHVYAALHVAERIQRGKVDVFINNAMLLQSHGWPFTINYVMYPPLIGQFESDYEFFATLGIPIEPKSFKGRYDGKKYPESYTEAERELIREYAPGDSYTREVPNYLGRRCNAGYRLVRVLEDGSMTRCVTDNEPLGNVFDGFELYDEPRPCRVTRCPCYGPKRLFDGIDEAQPAEAGAAEISE
jgi:MoaA/NifB/PqqE/SkfB family radical SAM enzyme